MTTNFKIHFIYSLGISYMYIMHFSYPPLFSASTPPRHPRYTSSQVYVLIFFYNSWSTISVVCIHMGTSWSLEHVQCTRGHNPEEKNDPPSSFNHQLLTTPWIDMVLNEPLINVIAIKLYAPDTTCHITFKLVLLIQSDIIW